VTERRLRFPPQNVAEDGPAVVFRCSEGHLFRLSRPWRIRKFAVSRLGFAVFMRCPAGKHWSLVRLVPEADLTEQERRALELPPFDYVREMVGSSIGILNGGVCLTIAIAIQSWWLAGLGAVLVALWGAGLVRANRRQAIEQREAGADVETDRRDDAGT
jgi:hypothetical protein